MIEIGQSNTLQVKAEFPFGFQLSSAEEDAPTVVLSRDNAPEGTKIDDELDVFVGTDDSGSLIAYTKPPKGMVGDTLILKAVGVTHFGAFFDWGLDKDLLVPSGMQEGPINEGMHYVVHIYYDDDTRRILGATRLHRFLKETDPELAAGDAVECTIYSKTDLGFKVVINNQYLGLIFHSDAFRKLKIGDTTPAIIKGVREDGKIDVALQRVDKTGRKTLEQSIIEDLEEHGGISTLTDKSPPEDIYSHFNVSKAAYKKALGALYKKKRILIDKEAVRLLDK